MKQHERRPGTVLRALRARAQAQRRFRRGVYLLPSMFTVANMFCGYACVVYAMRGEYVMAAPFIGVAIVLDMLDGRIARLTGTSSAFGLELDSLADVISFGLAPAILALSWGLAPLGRLGWAAGFLFVAGAAMRLARFNIQSAAVDKRYFVGLPSPAAAAVPAATVFAYPYGLHDYREALPALAMVLTPAFLMVSTVRFRSFKTFDLGWRRSYRNLILFTGGLVAVATHPQIAFVVMAYAYLASGPLGWLIGRLRRRQSAGPEGAVEPEAAAGAATAEREPPRRARS
jgi:CDP-diacylglycerol--serine O-phosphatidyltransferase